MDVEIPVLTLTEVAISMMFLSLLLILFRVPCCAGAVALLISLRIAVITAQPALIHSVPGLEGTRNHLQRMSIEPPTNPQRTRSDPAAKHDECAANPQRTWSERATKVQACDNQDAGIEQFAGFFQGTAAPDSFSAAATGPEPELSRVTDLTRLGLVHYTESTCRMPASRPPA